MSTSLPVSAFIKQSTHFPVIDVRSPAEFAQAHIPGAHSIPLFSNEERAEVGTIYKQAGKDAATLRGLQLVGPKMAGFAKQARQLAKEKTVLVHCWRGGMRSRSMAWLFETAGLHAYTLEGGYKAYRRYIRQQLGQPAPLIILGGLTGSGKTRVLHALRALGEQIIDLEALAHHKGSAFGAIGETAQPTNEAFENQLAHQWMQQNRQQRIWLEDESFKIGKVNIPKPLYDQMRAAPVIRLDVGLSHRIQELVQEYAAVNDTAIAEALHKIGKRLGGQHEKAALQALATKDYETVAREALRYYDKSYQHGLSRRSPETVFPFTAPSHHARITANRLLEWLNRHPAIAPVQPSAT